MSTLKSLMITAAFAGGLYAAKHAMVHEMSAKDVATQINTQVDLPLTIDKDVTLRRVTGQGSNLVFTYSLDDYGRSALPPELLEQLNPADKGDICRIISQMRKMNIDDDIVVMREYLNSYGSPIHSVQMPVSSCA